MIKGKSLLIFLLLNLTGLPFMLGQKGTENPAFRYRDVVDGVWPDSNGIPIIPRSKIITNQSKIGNKVKQAFMFYKTGNLIIKEGFDTFGRVIERQDNSEDAGKICQAFEVTYDKASRVDFLRMEYKQGRRNLIEKNTYRYDNQLLLERIFERTDIWQKAGIPDTFESTVKYYYSKGIISTVQIINESNQKDSKVEYFYDGKNNIIMVRKFSSEITPIQEEKFEYNSNGKLTLYKNTFIENGNFQKVLIGYDKKNRILQEKFYNNSDTVSIQKSYKYDKKGNIIELFIEPFGEFSREDVTKYKCKYSGNQKLEELILVAGKKKSKTTYSYNEIGLLLSVFHKDLDENDTYVVDEDYEIKYEFWK